MASNGNLQDWIISQYDSDGDLRLDFTNYAALQGSQGVLINSTAQNSQPFHSINSASPAASVGNP